MSGAIHDEHPFATPEAGREPVRRFRGRLVAPVTVITAGTGDRRTGLTVSSLLVADGEPGRIFFLCGRNADLWDVVQESGGFVVHALTARDRALADRFSGQRPSPGGLFAGLEVEDGPHGPVIVSLPTRAACRFLGITDTGWYGLVEGEVTSVAFHDLNDPLAYFRGRYGAGGAP